jgi:flagellar protein FlaG
MDIQAMKALTVVSVSLPATTDKPLPTATGAATPVVAKPIVDLPKQAPPKEAPRRDFKSQTAAIAEQLQAYLQSSDRDIEFRVDADTGSQVVTVRDAASGDVIRQMPSEEALRILKNLDAGQGTLLNERV